MKMNFYRLITVMLVLALVVFTAIGVSAAKTTGTQDGLYVVLTTDKAEYTAEEAVSVNVQIVNNAAAKADITTEISLPACLQVSSGALSQTASMEVGSVWQSDELLLEYVPVEAAEEEPQSLAWLWWTIGGVVVVAAAVFLFIYGKNLKSHVAILVLFATLLSFGAMAVPARAEAAGKTMEVLSEITVDSQPVELKLIVSYTIEQVQQEEEEVDDGRMVAFYYNDFEDPDRWIQDGATLHYGDDQLIDSAAEEKTGNHYGYIQIKNSTSAAYMQADLKESRPVDHMVVRMELSTGSFVPVNSYIQYRYNTTTNQMLLYITKDGRIQIGKTIYDNIRVEKGKWLKIEFIIDFTDPNKDTAQVYVNDKKLTNLELLKSEKNYPIPYIRFTVAGQDSTGASVGGSLWLDNLAVYEGKKRLPMDQMKSPKLPTGERRTIAPDEEMIHPELSDLGKDAVAVLAGSKNAYANEELVKLSQAATAVKKSGKIVDVMVPGIFLRKYLNIGGLEDGKMYSLKENAGGRNVLIDSRGLAIVSTKQLDKEKDIKLLTMVYGYLKTGKLANNYAVAPMLTQTVIDEAFTTVDVGFGPYSGTSNPGMKNMNAIYYLTLATYMDKTTASSDGKLCKDEAVRRIKRLISGGREPNATVGCFWEQSIVGNIMLLAKHTPEIWNELTAAEHDKIDLLMECLAIASNWGHNAGNDYSTGFDLLGNYGKDYNPNFKNASFVNYLSASMYFGAKKLDKIYENFNYDSYIKRLKKAGFTNILAQWTNKDLFGVDMGAYMTHGGEVLFEGDGVPAVALPGNGAGSGVGVKVPWSYEDIQNKAIYDRDDWYPMLFDHIEYTYGLAVISTNGIPGSMTFSYIMSGKTSPYAGKMGMLMEFSSIDGGGYTRSKCMYCYLSAQVMVGLYANLKLLGYWDYDSQTAEVAKRMREMDSRIQVGNEDLFFKLQEGYMGNSQQKQAEEHAEEFVQFGLKFVEDIWYNFHAMDNDPVEIVEKEQEKFLLDAAESKDGVTDAPKNAWVPADSDPSGHMHAEAEYEINGKCYQKGTLEFDLTIGDEMQEAFNGVVMFGQSKFGLFNYSDRSMLIALKNGDIYVYNEDEYAATGIKFGPNYKFHFKVAFDCNKRRYDVTVTQTWPKTDKPVTATVKDMWFRNTYAAKYVDSFQLNNQAMIDEFWVENVKISGTTRPKTDYTPYRKLAVQLDWGEVPASKRPSSVKAYLVYNGKTIEHKYVVLTAKNGWKANFDHIPEEINKRVAEYSVYLKPVAGYLAIPSDIKNNTITVTQTTRPVIYENDFQEGTLGKMTDNSGPYNMGVAQIVTSGKNKYLALNDKNNLEHQMGLVVDGMFIDGKLNNLYSVIFFEMDIKKAAKTSVVGGYAVGYRQARSDDKPGTASHNLVSVVQNSIRALDKEKAYTIGELTDDWQHLKVCLDIKNRRALIFYGSDSNYILLENLPAVVSNSFHISTWKNQNGLAVDNMKVYCDASLSLDKVLDKMTTTLTVEKTWASDVDKSLIPDTVKAYLVVNGKLTDKFVTLKKSDGWKAKSFTDLKVLVKGQKQTYSAVLAYVPGVVAHKTELGNTVTFTSYGKYTYYDNNFSSKKTEAMGVSFKLPDKKGNVMLASTRKPTFAGSNPYLVFTNDTLSLDNDTLLSASNVIIQMKLKADKCVNGGLFSLRYRGGEERYKPIFEVNAKEGALKYTFFGKDVDAMELGKWLDVRVMFDFENRVCRASFNGGEWIEAQGCPEITGNYIRIYANDYMKWGIDDLKVYSDGSWTTNELPATVDVATQVDWTDGTPGASSLTMQLYADGKKVSGKTLTLNAANGWKNTFKKLPTRDTFGKQITYTVKPVTKLTGYNTYYTGGGKILHYTKNTYYYWNDFTAQSMTDDNGVTPSTVTGPVGFAGKGDIYAKYRGTFGLNNDAFKTADNIVIGMKLQLPSLTKGSQLLLRYNHQPKERFELLNITVNSAGTQANLKLAGESVMNLEIQRWYDLAVVYDRKASKAALYLDGILVGKPVDCPKNVGNLINMYANNMDWQMDDLRIYCDAGLELDKVLDKLTTTLTVEKVWASDVDKSLIPDTVKAYLVVNGKLTDKFVTLKKSDGWKAKSFTDLKVFVKGESQTYSAVLAYIPGVVSRQTELGDKITFTSYGKYTYYDNNFATQKIEPVGVSYQVPDKKGNVMLASTRKPTLTGSNPYLEFTDDTLSLDNDTLLSASNVIIQMKLKADKCVNGGLFSLRYRGGEERYKPIFEVNAKDGALEYTFFGKDVDAMELGQWLDVRVMFDFENRVCRASFNGGEWIEVQGCPEITGNYIRMYANGSMKWGVDDLKVYSDGSWTTNELPATVDVETQVDWTDGTPGASSLTMQLYADGKEVSGKTLTLNADNSWKGVFKNLPTRDTFGEQITYTVKQVTKLTGYNTYYTGGGKILHHTKNTYYYWNDFTAQSMTDDNGVTPGTVTGPVSFAGEGNVYAGYRGTFGLNNDAFKTADNIVIAMKLRLPSLTKGAQFLLRYNHQATERFELLNITVNSAGTQATLKLADKGLMNLEAQKWYEFVVVYDHEAGKAALYLDGILVSKPVDCPENVGNLINMYANNMDWQMDDLRIYTDEKLDCYAQFRTDVKTALIWDDFDNAESQRPSSVAVELLADGVPTGMKATLNEAGQWKTVFADLPEFDSKTGKTIAYTVSAATENYTAKAEGSDVKMLLNLADITVDKAVTVVWDDQNNLEHRRPQSLKLQLYRDGKAVEDKTLTVNAAGNWRGTFENLPKYNSQTRKLYTYSVGAETVEKYTASIAGDTITMKCGLVFQIEAIPGTGLTPIPD